MTTNISSFLPEDYVAKKAERRTNVISLTLFGVVMIAVIGAFFVTSRQARIVKRNQELINQQYQEAGRQIRELTQLETQKQEMLHKAELAAALVERVPRSILLAELINRMPDRLALLEFKMTSDKMKAPPPPKKTDGKGRLVAPTGGRAQTKQQAGDETQKVEAPRYLVSIDMIGVAPTDLEVSKYMTELNAYPLMSSVTLNYSEEKEIESHVLRQFKISMTLDPSADVRGVDPLIIPRVKNPMTEQVQFQPTTSTSVSAENPSQEAPRP